MKPKATTSRAWVDYAERRYYFARFMARISIRGTSGIIRFHARVSATAFLKARLTAAKRQLPETDSACALLASCLDLEPRWQRYASFCHDLDEAAELAMWIHCRCQSMVRKGTTWQWVV